MLGVLLMLVPLVAAVIIMFAPARAARGVALIGTLVGLGLAILAAIDFNGWGSGGWGLEFHRDLLPSLGISLTFGADSVSMLLVLLTVLLMPLLRFSLGPWLKHQQIQDVPELLQQAIYAAIASK